MDPDIKRALGAVFIARTAANAGLRVVYPFLPAIARGLGVSPVTLSTVIAVRNLGGLATPAAARASERFGRRWMMLAAILSVALGCALTSASDRFVLAAVGIVLVGLAKPAFDIPMQAWFGDRVPYGERGRVFGITELTWATALLVAAPLSGILIELTDWRAPFVLVAAWAALGAMAVARAIEPDAPHEWRPGSLAFTAPRVRMLGVALLFSIAAEIPFIVYGQWLEETFGLSISGIGVFTLAVVLAEFMGEGLVVLVADRMGLRRMILSGLLVSGIAYLGLSVAGSVLAVAALVVVVWIAAFEVTIVAAIPFVSELAAEARDRLLSMLAVMIALGRAIGALVAQPLYAAGGISLGGMVSACCVCVAALMLLTVEEPREAGAAPIQL
ncbi:MAG: MFS transporter [Actinomycetota bacterium]